MIYLQRGVIVWVDPYMVRRDSGPEYSGLRLGLADPGHATGLPDAVRLHVAGDSVIAHYLRRAGQLCRNGQCLQGAASGWTFSAGDPGYHSREIRKPSRRHFSRKKLDVRLSVIPLDEIPALVEDSMALPPIDLTLPANAYADLSVFALVPVPRSGFTALKNSLPTLAPNPTVPQILSFRTPTQLFGPLSGHGQHHDCRRRIQNSAWQQRHPEPDLRFLIRATAARRLM
jgi:hypothetical protein